MPSSASTSGSRDAPAMKSGRTKWSVTKISTAPNAPSSSAAVPAPRVKSSSTAADSTTAAPNGTMPTSPVPMPHSAGCGTPASA